MRGANASTWRPRGHVKRHSLDDPNVVAVRNTNLSSDYADIRCYMCQRLLFRWRPAGSFDVSVKCPRCGALETRVLTT